MVEGQDIHDRPLSDWGQLEADLVGAVVRVEIVCAHSFGLGVRLLGHGAYGHINSPRVTDGRYTLEGALQMIGDVRTAQVLAVTPGRQPTLTIRPSEIPEA